MICCGHIDDLLQTSDDLFVTILMICCGHSDDLLLTF